jgi:hypothetical protein
MNGFVGIRPSLRLSLLALLLQSLNDLVGRKVNFNTQGTTAAYWGPLIFSRLGLEVENRHVPYFAIQNPWLPIGVQFWR